MKRATCDSQVEGQEPPAAVQEVKRAKLEVEHPLSPSQQLVLDKAIAGESFFFTGAAGTGKSYLLGYIHRALVKKYGEDAVYITASTGIAACNIGGTTLHAFAGIGLGDGNLAEILKDLQSSKPWCRTAVKRWKGTMALIIDECSMISPKLYEKLDKIGSFLRETPTAPFGGIQVILCGDFFQLPPVDRKIDSEGKRKKKDPEDLEFLFETKTWSRLVENRVYILRDIFRQTEPVFLSMLDDFRHGNISPQSIATFQDRRNITEAAESLPEDTVRLYSTRKEVDILNFCEMDKIEKEPKVFTAVDHGEELVVKKMEDHWMAPKTLILKVGASVMLVKNISFGLGLVNGRTGRVVKFEEGSGNPVVKFYKGGEHVMGPVKWELKSGKKVIMSHSQIPLVLSYAVTIHKSQGMSIENVEINTSKIFEPAQLYTALSRSTSLNGLFIRGTLPKAKLTKPNEKVAEWWKSVV